MKIKQLLKQLLLAIVFLSAGLNVNANCSQPATLPFVESFSGGGFLPDCWTTHDVDGNGVSWGMGSINNDNAVASYYSSGIEDNWLVSPRITVPVSGNLRMEFESHILYVSNAVTSAYILTGSNDPADGNYTQVWTITRETDNSWKPIQIDLSTYAGQDIYICFRCESSENVLWYVRNLKVYDSNLVDAAVAAIISPVSGVNLTNAEMVTATIKNNSGTTTITGFELKLEVDGVIMATETYTESIEPLNAADYTFSATADLSAIGSHTVKVTVNLTGDENATNDSFTKTVTNTICSTITIFPWREGFEDDIALICWDAEYVNGTSDWQWETGSGSGSVGGVSTAHSGTKNMSLFNSVPGTVTKLITPSLDLFGVTDPVLNFWHVQKNWSSDQDELRVYYKTSAVSEWNLLAEYTTNIPEWTEVKLMLPNASVDYYIAFEGTANYGYGIGLDDVEVTASSGMSIEVQESQEVKVYPNPIKDMLHIESSGVIRKMFVYNMDGQLMNEYPEVNNAIDMSHLSQGVYMLKIVTENGDIIRKVTKL